MTASPSSDLDTEKHIELMVRADKLKLLFQQSFPALFISLVGAFVLGWMLWGYTDAFVLLGWIGVLFLATLGRAAMFLSYFRAAPSGQDVLKWEKPYVATLIVSSLIWGFGALLVMPRDSLLHEAVTLFVLIGMAGGAVSTYSAHRFVAVASMTAVLLPSTVWLSFQTDRVQIGMAIGAILFMVASLRATKVMASALHRNFQLTRELTIAHDLADRLAKTDALTGINSRRAFFECAEQIVKYCRRHERQVCTLVMDIDHFKSINDTRGHLAGDMALQHVGEILRSAFRKSDVCGRIGGEEFAVLLPDTTAQDARTIADKLRCTIAETPAFCLGQELRITVSIGVASGSYDLETLLHQADSAMYRAKAEGRDRVICHEPGADGRWPADAPRPAGG